MHTLLLIIFTGVVFLPCTSQFFTALMTTLQNYASGIVVCSQQIDTVYGNGTTTYQYSGYLSGGYYCAIAITTSLVNNLSQTVTSRFAIYPWNMYRNLAVNRCGFSTTMDIGYGNCTPYYYETATSMQLCICSTNNCSDTYSTCQVSVNQVLSSPPPMIPFLLPTLSNTITCQDMYFNTSVAYNVTPPWYYGCTYLINIGSPDVSRCYTYTPNHTVLCGLQYDAQYGSFEQMALIEGTYEEPMLLVIERGLETIVTNSSMYLYQTSTSVAIILSGVPGQPAWGECFCTTNNCNADFATCIQGMNIPSYLLNYNGSNSSISTTSTGSTSSRTSVSSGSTTTRSTSNSSSIIITSLLSSTTTAAGVSSIVPSTAVGINNTLSGTVTQSSLGIKSNRSFFLTMLISVAVITAFV